MKVKYRKEDAVRKIRRSNPLNPANLNREKNRNIPNRYITRKNLVNCITLIKNQKFHTFCREKILPSIPDITTEEIKIIYKEALKTIAYRMVHNEAGVFIKDYGYFSVFRYPQKRIIEKYNGKEMKRYTNLHTDGVLYSLSFIPIRKDNALKVWQMDKTFLVKKISRVLYYQLIDGKKYKSAYTPLQNLYGNRIKTLDAIKKNNDNQQ